MWIATWYLGIALFSSYPAGPVYVVGNAIAQLTSSERPIVLVSKPQNLTVVNVTSRSIQLTWEAPQDGADTVTGYSLYYTHDNNTYAKNLPNIHQHTIIDLKPFTEYKMYIIAVGEKRREGEVSDTISQFTDVDGPGPPIIMNATCVPGTSGTSIYLQWSQPEHFYKSVDEYFISITKETNENIKIKVSAPKDSLNYVVQNLTENTKYELKINGATNSYLTKNLIEGQPSDARTVYLHRDCDHNSWKNNPSIENTKSILIGLCCVFGLLFIIATVLFWKCHNVCRVYFHAAYYYLEDPPCVINTLPTLPNSEWWKHKEESQIITVDEFGKHVTNLHVDGDIGFSKEYEIIQEESINFEFSTDASQLPENKSKNRYLNIVPYDHSRVKLIVNNIPGSSHSDYINANYIDGFEKANAYIGTQGPLPSTINDFWQMIWEQHVYVIIMITNLVERGRRKCDLYWPNESVETYGFIQVKLLKEEMMAMYTVRTFQINHTRTKKKKNLASGRTIYQYHYTNWPDHGTPDHALPILSFINKSSGANPSEAGPIVVHCSAGVGRTGTYIVLDTMLKQIRSEREVNIFGFLKHIRQQRNFLVQTEEQYIFIHDALLEAINCMHASINEKTLASYLQTDIQDSKIVSFTTDFEKHYKMITSFVPQDYLLLSANKAFNRIKNRSQEFVPVEYSRVHLTPKPGVEGSDYINASWIIGFKRLGEFIVTQHPLKNTILDFWQMLWDHNAQTVVILTDMNEDPESLVTFWPVDSNTTLDSDNFKVKSVQEDKIGNEYETRDLVIQSIQDDFMLPVRLIHSKYSIRELSSLIKLLEIVQMWHLEYQNGPIVVVDKYGGTESAIFCCLTTIGKQLQHENLADVTLYAKLYHNQRPGIWKNIENYLLLYRALELMSGGSCFSVLPPSAITNINNVTNNSHNSLSLSNGNALSPNKQNGILISQ
ncbi:tyrosine-protein phosphatase 99A-like isoform X3 [Daktulosphaira vitifoliae]|uniref:tyrosine-protein phosphatase 99A-like isoform X3 n=1 Tax=Daktulosphaira vitifoliae TaxID=58002 RepID=UPI0021AA59F7|nr:tyrosine-protein phosphatase 99A-like isoform X3 [Daktulosphaira vitifoliae]